MYRARRILAAVLLTALPLAGCASPDDGGADPVDASPQPGAGDIVRDGVHNGQDVAFTDTMILHHRQGIEMARSATGRTQNPKVLALAREVEAEQTSELAEMTGWLGEWGRPLPTATTKVTDDVGLVPATGLATLRTAQDAAFDRLFLTLMITNHVGGVAQAQDEQRTGADERARGLAEDIAGAEEERVTALKQLLG